MNGRLIDLLLGLTTRERLLLAAALLVILLALGLGLLLPLQERRQHAQARLGEIQALELWIAERIVEKQGLNSKIDPVPQAAIGTSGIERGLITAQLRPALTSLSTTGDGAIDLRFDQVDFTQLGRWLNAAHPGWGYQIESLRLEALEGAAQAGRVAAWISLRPLDP